MPEFPDGSVADNATPSRPGFKMRKRAHAALYTFIAIFITIVVAYNYAMRPAFLEPLIKKQFAANTNGTIELRIDQASLFRGFKFSNVVVHSPAGYSQTPLFAAKEITLLYNLYGFFRGRFGVHEIGLREPKIHIEKKKNILNITALLKPSVPKPEVEKEKSDKTKYSWFFNVQVFSKLLLENLHITYDARDASNKTREYAHLRNFSLHFSLLTRDFSKIDIADYAGMIALLNALVIELNPQNKIDVAYEGPKASLASPLQLSWLLFYDGQSVRPEFKSRMQIGQEQFPVALARGTKQNISFLVDHRAEYDAKADRFRLDSFNIKVLGDTLLSLTGEGEKVLKPDRTIKLTTGNSRVNLGRVHDIVSQLTGKRETVYSGFFSIKPTSITVHNQEIKDQGGLKLERVSFRQGKMNISVPAFELDHSADINTALKPIPLKSGKARLKATINGAPLSLDAEMEPSRKTNINFSLRGLNPGSFTAGSVQGNISTTFTAIGESPQNLAIALRVFSPQVQYFIDRGKSGINRIEFNVRGDVKSNADFSQNAVNLPVITFSQKDREYLPALDLKSHLKLDRTEHTHIVYGLDALKLHFKELLNTMPTAQQEMLGVQVKFLDPGRTLRADGETSVTIADGNTAIIHLTRLALPDAHVDDVEIHAKVRMNPPFTHIDQFTLTGLHQALTAGASGHLKNVVETRPDPVTGKPHRAVEMSPDLKFRLSVAKSEESEILDDTFLVGDLSLTGTAKGDIVAGYLKINNLNFRNPKVRINKANMDFPFKHDRQLKKTLNLRAGNKERIIKNYSFNKPYNFSIRSIDIPDPNNKKEWLQLVYSRGTYPAVGASMEYKDNVFVMPVLQLYTLNGVVTISDTLFNLGRLKPSEMEYSSTIQIKDIDLKQLMVKDKADTITDGKLRIDMLFTGNRLDKPVENLSGYLSVYRIGPEFAQMVMRASNPKQANLVSSIASSAAKPQRIDIDIKEGFIYTHIPMTPGIVGRIFLSPEEYNNRRINIPEFFQRISNEAKVYSNSTAAQTN